MAHTIGTKLDSAGSAGSKSLWAIGKIRRLVVKILTMPVIWQERAEQRALLGELNERMLKDIGVTAAEAYRESRKPFWLP